MLKPIRNFARDDAGVTMLEYTILLAIITVGAIATITLVGGKVSDKWNTFNTSF